jgi:hypothetical protein
MWLPLVYGGNPVEIFRQSIHGGTIQFILEHVPHKNYKNYKISHNFVKMAPAGKNFICTTDCGNPSIAEI